MLLIQNPPTYLAERSYIYDVTLREFLGLDYRSRTGEGQAVRIRLDQDPSGRELVMPDVLFQTPASEWLTGAALPQRPLRHWQVPERIKTTVSPFTHVPVLYGAGGDQDGLFKESRRGIALGLDFFGSAFWALTRYEEIVSPAKDKHGRFPIHAALAFQEGFLERPIINEYLEILWAAFQRLWPLLQRKPRLSRVLMSHDVDFPLCTAGRKRANVQRSILADVAIRHDSALALRRWKAYGEAQKNFFDNDPFNTFELIMDMGDRLGRQSEFNFVPEPTAGRPDGNYDLESPWFRKLLRRIHERGHILGFHPSYSSWDREERIRQEFLKLKRVCREEDIVQEKWGGRQHFLRWKNPESWQYWETAGLDHDSTLGFSAQAGFRCGACFTYPVFNLVTRKKLKLLERPLIAMDVALFPGWRFDFEKCHEKIIALNKICRSFNGDFTLLWHNNSLLTKAQRDLFRQVSEDL
jgi:hypothetical protein